MNAPHEQNNGTGGRRIRLVIEYDGTNYCGWQRQKGDPTIQEAVERAAGLVADRPVTIHGAGRTDAGVHALGQVAHFICPVGREPGLYKRALNRLLPNDIAICEASDAESGFHARFSAKSKTYRYRILNRQTPSALDRHRAWFYPRPLDYEAMAECLGLLEGRHDFSSFQAAGSITANAVRTVLFQEILRDNEGEVTIEVRADGFLRHMVRNIVGTIVEAGRGKMSVSRFKSVLEARDRTQAGPTAPAHGLYLVKVHY